MNAKWLVKSLMKPGVLIFIGATIYVVAPDPLPVLIDDFIVGAVGVSTLVRSITI